MILTLFRPFDSKCKKLLVKKLWKCIFKASRRVSFSHFPKVALNHKEKMGAPQYLLDFLWIMSQHSNQHGAVWQRIGNGWKLLLAIVALSFIITMRGLWTARYLTLKCIDRFRSRQWSIPYAIYVFKVRKKTH